MHNKRMTSKALNLALKRPDPISYLMDRFDIQTEEALFDCISNVSPTHFEWFIKEMKKKQSKQRKADTKKLTHSMAQEKSSKATLEEKINLCDETTDLQELTQPEESMEPNPEITGMSLDELRRHEREISESLTICENRNKVITKKCREYFAQMVAEKKAFQDLLAQVNIHHKLVLDLHAKCEECLEEMQAIDEDIRVHKDILEELQSKIVELKRVVIFVYDNGSIEVVNAEMPAISETRIKEEFDKLIVLPEAEEITIKNVRSIAKLRAMEKDPSRDFNIIFESDKLEALYIV